MKSAMMKRTRTAEAGGILAGLIGTLIAVLEGFSSLSCGSTPSILIVIAGSFGAGAGLASAVAARRMQKQTGTVAAEEMRTMTELLRRAAEEQRQATTEQQQILRAIKEAAARPPEASS